MVLHLLHHPDRIAGASPVARQVLDALVPVWPTLTRGETNEVVRLLVWAAMWNHAKRRVTLVLDETGLERFADEYRVELGLASADQLFRVARNAPVARAGQQGHPRQQRRPCRCSGTACYP